MEMDSGAASTTAIGEKANPPGAHVLQAMLQGRKLKITLDCGAVITVVKIGVLPGPRAPPSRLRLKGVNPGTQTLYGPRKIEIQLGSVKVLWDVYEADI